MPVKTGMAEVFVAVLDGYMLDGYTLADMMTNSDTLRQYLSNIYK